MGLETLNARHLPAFFYICLARRFVRKNFLPCKNAALLQARRKFFKKARINAGQFFMDIVDSCFDPRNIERFSTFLLAQMGIINCRKRMLFYGNRLSYFTNDWVAFAGF